MNEHHIRMFSIFFPLFCVSVKDDGWVLGSKIKLLFSVQVRKHVNDLYEDLRDGHNLISLLEVLSGDTLVSFKFLIYFQGHVIFSAQDQYVFSADCLDLYNIPILSCKFCLGRKKKSSGQSLKHFQTSSDVHLGD